MNKNEGFTLIEMIAALIIIGLLLLIAVPSIAKLLEKNRQSYYRNIDEIINKSAISYITEKQSLRPKRGGNTSVCLLALEEEDYLEPVRDYKKQLCDIKESNNDQKSYVVLFRQVDGSYKAVSCLWCDRSGYRPDSNLKPVCYQAQYRPECIN